MFILKNKRLLLRYYKRRLYNDRSLFARAVDFIALRIILLALCYLWFMTRLDNTVMAAILSFTALGAISAAAEILKSMRLSRFIAGERARTAERIFRERLLILPQRELLALVKAYIAEHRDMYADDCLVCTVRTCEALEADAVYRAYRNAESRGLKSVLMVSTAPVAKGAAAAAERFGETAVRFITPDKLITSAGAAPLIPTADAVDAALLSAAEKAKAARKKTAAEPFAAGRMRRYILIAVALFALSFFVKYALYYRMLAAFSLSFGALAFWLNTASPAREPGRAV